MSGQQRKQMFISLQTQVQQLEAENLFLREGLEEIRDGGSCNEGEMGFDCGMCGYCIANQILKGIEQPKPNEEEELG